ncbi:MAG TPA: phospholipid carrier-dependent glycosyltransferase [Anaerolineae bacterium]|nr:phospholipid carrier-dependent glycosyltransferase [Anaerolineae bacterium]
MSRYRLPEGYYDVRLDWLWAEDRPAKFILGSTLVLGALTRLVPIATNRFHQDEALYSTWALHIATGRDVLLNGLPVDKPPLFLYTLALFFKLFGPSEVTARLPGVLASTASVALVYYLALRLYGRPTALVATALMALSPFNILFAPTALTDPLLVALVLGALCLAVEGHWTGAGIMAGLAAAAKQQGLFFLPLVVGVGLAAAAAEINLSACSGRICNPADGPTDYKSVGSGGQSLWRAYAFNDVPHFGLGFLAAVAPAILWDLVRSQRPGFLQQSAISYGGLAWVAPSQWLERWQRWVDLLWYVTASRPLNLLLMVGVPLLLLYGFLWRRRERETIADATLAGFGFLFLTLHLVLDFQVWDRYLLGLVPIVLLLLARVLWQGSDVLAALASVVWTQLSSHLPPGLCSKRVRGPASCGAIVSLSWPGPPGHGPGGSRRGAPLTLTPLPTDERGSWRLALQAIATAVFLTATLYRPAQDAANSRFPIGGDQGAYQGIEMVADYFRGNVGAGATLYQRWLGWHLAFYMFNYPYDFQWYDSPQQLANHAAKVTGPRYLVAPGWKSVTEEKVALGEKGLSLHTVYQAYRHDGSASFTIYRVEETGRE